MNVAFLALIKIAKLLYPFIKESILGQDSVLTILRKRKVFVFVMVSNLILFLTTTFLAEQNFILLDRLKVLNEEIVVNGKKYSDLEEKNARLIGLLHGDMDEICFAHVFGKETGGTEAQSTNTSTHLKDAPDGNSETALDSDGRIWNNEE